MNRAIRLPFMCHHQPESSIQSRTAAALFHSTPLLERRRRPQNYGSSPFTYSSKFQRFNNYTKRSRRMEAKQALLRNVSMYAEYLFQSWKLDSENTSEDSSWYKKQYESKEGKGNQFSSRGSQWGTYRNKRRGRFEFCLSDDDDFETIFKSAFKGRQGFYWSFSTGENFNCGFTPGSEYQSESSSWRYSSDYIEDDTSTLSDLASERLTLGLKASGPLKLEEVKKAYRVCALRWHPDRHQGLSKVEAEEKFKNCSAAYESLCEKLALG